MIDWAPVDTGLCEDPTRFTGLARVRRALVHHGLPCRVLDAVELAELYLEAEDEGDTAGDPGATDDLPAGGPGDGLPIVGR